MIKIPKNTLDEIVAHARRDLPIEACGYLAMRDHIVERHYAMKNMDSSNEHFTFDPKEQFDVLRKMRSLGLKPNAVYHSHPETPARLSEEDIRLAVDPNISYVIVSMKDDRPVVKSFTVVKKRVEEEEIEIIESDREHHKLDITKDQCPITFVKVKVKLAKLQKGSLLEVLLNPGEPLKNVPRSAEEQGHKVHEIEPDGEFFRVLIEKGS